MFRFDQTHHVIVEIQGRFKRPIPPTTKDDLAHRQVKICWPQYWELHVCRRKSAGKQLGIGVIQ